MSIPSSSLFAGVTRVDVTPPLGTYLGGFGVSDRFAERVDDPLYATALALRQGDVQAALLELDWVMIEEDERYAIASAVEKRIGVPKSNLLVHAIQTHSAPYTQKVFGWGKKDMDYIMSVTPKIIDGVCEAFARLTPVKVGIGVGHSEAGVNRRFIHEDGTVALGVNPFGPYDPEVTLLRFDAENGHLATIVNYGAHPTTRHGDSRAVSRDWPGVMVDFVEAHTRGVAMFLNGVVGDVAPRNTLPGPRGTVEVGTILGREAVRVFDTIECHEHAELRVLAEEIQVPLAPLKSRAEAEAILKSLPDSVPEWGLPAARKAHCEMVLAEWESGSVKTHRPFLQAMLQIGEAALAPFPGEAFAEVGLRLKLASPYKHTLIASTTNGGLGYLATREARARGGYEVQVAEAFGPYLLSDKIDDFLVVKYLELLRRLRA